MNDEDPGIAHLVHDLRNELTLIKGQLDRLAGLERNDEVERLIRAVQQGTERALRLANGLLSATRPDTAVRRRLDLNHLVASTAESLARAAGPGILIDLQLATEPVPVFADRLDLERILLNLLIDARDAMGGGGVIKIETAIVGTGSERRVRLTVTHSGRGIAPEMGPGLGLRSVEIVVRQLGGEIAVDSQRSGGAAVTILLPHWKWSGDS